MNVSPYVIAGLLGRSTSAIYKHIEQRGGIYAYDPYAKKVVKRPIDKKENDLQLRFLRSDAILENTLDSKKNNDEEINKLKERINTLEVQMTVILEILGNK
jgi:hypothetical protein